MIAEVEYWFVLAGGAAKTQTTPADASRIQSSQAKSGNDTGKGSFASRAQGAATRNATGGPKGAPTPKAK
ncbi:hypothetical protein K474DRAFT_1602385 [Panus rudis PR-1116 ss-1]|nr:hypothetical protein K474DRAFT_1602385 [Panus rudis PR-1116 ss-1]